MSSKGEGKNDVYMCTYVLHRALGGIGVGGGRALEQEWHVATGFLILSYSVPLDSAADQGLA